MIEGVTTKRLEPRADERGALMEILRSDDPIYEGFAQVYATLNYPGVVRAWHWHAHQVDLFTVVQGMVKIVLYDRREGSPTFGEVNEFFVGEQNPIVLRVPEGVYHGYKTIGVAPALLLNFPSQLYNREQPDEMRIPYDSDEVPYDWEIKMH